MYSDNKRAYTALFFNAPSLNKITFTIPRQLSFISTGRIIRSLHKRWQVPSSQRAYKVLQSVQRFLRRARYNGPRSFRALGGRVGRTRHGWEVGMNEQFISVPFERYLTQNFSHVLLVSSLPPLLLDREPLSGC
jgi:hypothetical protein